MNDAAERAELGEVPISVVSVLLPLPLDGAYDYSVPSEMRVQDGSFVEVPLGTRTQIGVVMGSGDGGVDEERLKPITRVLPVAPMAEDLRQFVMWVADYTFSKPGSVLALTLRARQALEEPKTVSHFRLGDGPPPTRITAARQRVLEVASDGMVRLRRDLAREAGVGESVVKGLTDLGALECVQLPGDAPFPEPDPNHPGPNLSDQQRAAADQLREKISSGGFSVAVLDGVTGSGKTETYFDAVAEALRKDAQVLILLPEIALTVQILDRFADRFGCRPAVWHSGLSQAERRRTYRAVLEGQAKVVIGARSALFLPFAKLGLIVVDEEHETTYKQEDGVVYHARDMAVVRGSLSSFPVVLASATPSLETMVNIEQGKYLRLELPSRHGVAELPEVTAVDMRAEKLPADRFLSQKLRDAMSETFASGEQVLLFLNRRGYAPLTLCRTCGHRMMSPDSSSWLVEHRFLNRLVCHHSGYSIPKPKHCPECNAEDSLAACGPGVERLAEEVATLFPDVATEIMSSDTMRGHDEAQALLDRMADGEIDLLIGTQVVAKGHNFPGLTLVGVVDADLGLKGGDLRASERTYQLLHQVAGRAGRADKPGRVLVQTYMPDHPVMGALISGDRGAFLSRESMEREMLSMPPFGRLVGVVISGPDAQETESLALSLVREAPRTEQVRLLGPAPAPIGLLRGRHRFRLLMKAPRAFNVQAYLQAWFDGRKTPARMRVSVDVDPYSFL